jgi:hypothetical protein
MLDELSQAGLVIRRHGFACSLSLRLRGHRSRLVRRATRGRIAHDQRQIRALSHVVESRIVGADGLEAVEFDGDRRHALSAESVQQLGQ